MRLNPAFAQARVDLANALLARGEATEAVDQCREVLQKSPGAVQAVIVMGAALVAQGKAEEALPQFERAVTLQPQNANAHFQLGLTLNDLGRSKPALAHLDEAIRLQPGSAPMLWQTAWILATSPDGSSRNGARAVELATKAVQLSEGKEVHAFDALAAALAETGDFSAAVEVAEKASAMALVRNDDKLTDAIEQRTRLYRQRLPYRRPAALRRMEMHHRKSRSRFPCSRSFDAAPYRPLICRQRQVRPQISSPASNDSIRSRFCSLAGSQMARIRAATSGLSNSWTQAR